MNVHEPARCSVPPLGLEGVHVSVREDGLFLMVEAFFPGSGKCRNDILQALAVRVENPEQYCVFIYSTCFFCIMFDYDGTTCPHTQYSSTAWGHKDKDTRGARVSSFDIIDRRCGVYGSYIPLFSGRWGYVLSLPC